jgi:hypothetical protein
MRRPVAFLLHPEGRQTERQSTAVSLSRLSMTEDGLDSVRIMGVATNELPFQVKNPIVTGVLVDAKGRMVGLGYTYVLVEGIDPGESVSFDLRVSNAPYLGYRVYAQAERDW